LTRYSYAVGVYGTVVICPSVRNGCIVAKRCEIGLGRKLSLITNRKSHTLFQMI